MPRSHYALTWPHSPLPLLLMLFLTQYTMSLHSDQTSRNESGLVLSYPSQRVSYQLYYFYSFFTLLPIFTIVLSILHVPKDSPFWKASLILSCLGIIIINPLIIPPAKPRIPVVRMDSLGLNNSHKHPESLAGFLNGAWNFRVWPELPKP